MDKKTDLLAKTLDDLFKPTKNGAKEEPPDSPPTRRELELAATVLLVDLASCDANFAQSEYHLIFEGLNRIFGTAPNQAQALINQANLVLANLRGTQQFTEMLRSYLADDEKKLLLEALKEVMRIDNVEDGFEIYLWHKYAAALDIKEGP